MNITFKQEFNKRAAVITSQEMTQHAECNTREVSPNEHISRTGNPKAAAFSAPWLADFGAGADVGGVVGHASGARAVDVDAPVYTTVHDELEPGSICL